MAYSFDREESIPEGLRRNARSQVEEALRDLEKPEERGRVESVHDARKRCKKLRALARLARPAIGDLYERSNVAFRDAARELSDIRDSQVRVETFDKLLAAAPEGMELPDLQEARDEIADRHRAASDRLDRDPARLESAHDLIQEGWDVVRAWELEDDFEVLAGGVAKTYKRARQGHRDGLDAPSVEVFHEWRKRVKYHWYHLRMFTGAEPRLLEPWADRLHDLSDLAGDDHDLAELTGSLEADPEAFGGTEAVETLVVLAKGRSAHLRRDAIALGARLTVEKPGAVVSRLACCWRAWKEYGASPTRAGLADFANDSS